MSFLEGCTFLSRNTNAKWFAASVALVLLCAASSVSAQDGDTDSPSQSNSSGQQRIDIGGQKFGGGGDKKKPKCQISHPLSAGSPFYIEWNCEDDTATRGELTTEIWVLRVGAPRYVKVADYLGFPASLEVNADLLGGPLTDSLPASFVLVARDTAGNAAMSAPFTITNRDNDVDTCTLNLSTRATESDGSTTGVPSMSATLTSVPVFTQSTSNSTFVVSMFSEEVAEPCELEDLCETGEDDDLVFFTASITVDTESNASARLNLSPGDFVVTLEGSGAVNESILDSVELQGTTLVDDTVTDVRLRCSQSAS